MSIGSLALWLGERLHHSFLDIFDISRIQMLHKKAAAQVFKNI